jgi:hypothetical protein
MNKRTKKLLLDAIQHWHENLDMLILNHLSGEKDLSTDIYMNSEACPLCVEYLRGTKETFCALCPIFAKTECLYCEDTPFDGAGVWMDETPSDYEVGYKVISAELEFLYSLLSTTHD